MIKLLRTIKTTEDASTEPVTSHVHLMCDVALALAKQLLKLVVKEDEVTIPKVPGGVPLPQQLFRSVPERRRGISQLSALCSLATDSSRS